MSSYHLFHSGLFTTTMAHLPHNVGAVTRLVRGGGEVAWLMGGEGEVARLVNSGGGVARLTGGGGEAAWLVNSGGGVAQLVRGDLQELFVLLHLLL